MKAVISNRIYMEVPIDKQLEIDKELTYTIASHNPNAMHHSHARTVMIHNLDTGSGICRRGFLL